MKILVFGDAHDTPDTNKLRFQALGNYILQQKPDHIVQLGDFSSLDSLSHWDKDKRLTMEGRRYREEIDSTKTCIKHMIKPIEDFNYWQKSSKKAQYRPKWHWFLGNHEQRLNRYIDQHAELWDTLDYVRDAEIGNIGDVTVYQYPCVGEIMGVYYCHAPHNRVGPINSQYVGERTLDWHEKSVVYGHTHRYQVASRFRYGSDHPIYAVNCGCFFDRTPEYAVGGHHDYWKGILVLDYYQDGKFDVTQVSLEKLYRQYI